MSIASTPQGRASGQMPPLEPALAAAAGPGGAPVSDADPFSNGFFEDPHRIHEELREAGPVVWLSRYGVYAVARYAEVHAV